MSIHGSQGMQLALTAQYALSPVGLDAETTCAALRARVSRLRESEVYLPMPAGPEAADDVPLTAACVPDLDVEVQGIDRLFMLALGALRGLVARAEMARAELARTAILVALPAADAIVGRWNLGQVFVPNLLARGGLDEIADDRVKVEQGGNTAVLSELGTAAAWLDSGAVDQCIVLAADSYLDFERLRTLDLAYRLKSERGVDGFVPGEAAVALLLEPSTSRKTNHRPRLARLTLPVLTQEPRPLAGDKPSTGTGLVTALRGALRGLSESKPAGWFLCDMNGESYRAFEWGLARARLGEALAGDMVVQHPADCIGDTGAACAGLLIACATQAYVRKYAQHAAAVIWSAADAGSRGAMLVLPP